MWIFWATWVATGLGVELWAATNRKQNDTLSEQVWAVNKLLKNWPWARIPAHFLLAGFLLVLIPHFIWGFNL